MPTMTTDRKHRRRRDDPTSLLPKKLARSRPLFDPEIVGRAVARLVRQAEPGHAAEESR